MIFARYQNIKKERFVALIIFYLHDLKDNRLSPRLEEVRSLQPMKRVVTNSVISKKYCVTPKVIPCPTKAIKRISKKSEEFTKRNLFFLLSNLDI